MAWNPGVRDISGALLGEGISQAGNAFANTISRLGELKEKRDEELKAKIGLAKAFKKSLKTIPEGERPLSPEEAEMLSVDDVIAEGVGFMQALDAKGKLSNQKSDQLQQKRLQQQIDQSNQQQTQDSDLARYLEEITSAPAPLQNPADYAGPSLAQVLNAYGRAGAVPPAGLTEQLGRSRGGTFDMNALKGLGINTPTGATVNPNGTVSINMGPPPVPGPTEATPIFTTTGEPTGSARFGEKVLNLPDPTKATIADQTFKVNAAEGLAKLKELEDLINKYGNFETVAPEASARLPQLQYSLALTYAKLVDPASVAREGEVASAQKYMLPLGLLTRNATSLAAIKGMREEIQRRAKEYEATSIQKPTRGTQPDTIKGAKIEDEPIEAQARAAIAAGKDEAAVRARYKQLTGKELN